jgi:hypothetical protein
VGQKARERIRKAAEQVPLYKKSDARQRKPPGIVLFAGIGKLADRHVFFFAWPALPTFDLVRAGAPASVRRIARRLRPGIVTVVRLLQPIRVGVRASDAERQSQA